ncbi:MAG: ParB/RepB/Spo0J family partition protein [Xanthobacteraceae bacterium]
MNKTTHKVHPAANLFPMMDDAALKELATSIKDKGQQLPITFWKKTGELLDGRNRLAACQASGARPKTNHYEGDDPVGFILAANIHRRHLTANQKRELIGKLLKLNPEKSDRALATTIKVDHKTVAKERRKKVGRGEIPHQTKRTDTRGRKQSATKPRLITATVKDVSQKFATHIVATKDAMPTVVAPISMAATAASESARALKELKYAIGQWLPKLTADDLKEALAYFKDRAETREKAARVTKSAKQSVEERQALNAKLAESEPAQ